MYELRERLTEKEELCKSNGVDKLEAANRLLFD
jgi:hypothetical protein